MHILHVLNHLLQAGKNCKAALIRVLAVKNVENNPGLSFMMGKIAVSHGHFIQIHHHADIAGGKLCHIASPLISYSFRTNIVPTSCLLRTHIMPVSCRPHTHSCLELPLRITALHFHRLYYFYYTLFAKFMQQIRFTHKKYKFYLQFFPSKRIILSCRDVAQFGSAHRSGR